MDRASSEASALGPKAMQADLFERQARHLESMREELRRRRRKALLERCRRVAVLGASPDPSSASYLSIEKLLGLGLEIVVIMPGRQDYLGLPCYDHLRDAPGDVDIVQIYPGAGVDLALLATEAAQKKVKVLWIEEGEAIPQAKAMLPAGEMELVEGESLEREYIEHFLFIFSQRGILAEKITALAIRDLMTVKLVTVKPSDAIKEALDKMERGRFRHLPVVDEEGRLVGMISDRDIRLIHPSPLFVRPEHVASQLLMIKVRQAAVLNPVVIDPGASLEEAADLMLRSKVGALPVVGDGGIVVGIVTYADLLRGFLTMEKRRQKEKSI